MWEFRLSGADFLFLSKMRINIININKVYVIFGRNETGESHRDIRGRHITLFNSLPWYNSGAPFLTLRASEQSASAPHTVM
jgi:hypothetical protein